MKTIWKFSVPRNHDTMEVQMPKDAVVLCMQLQGNTPCLWARVDTEAPLTPRRFVTLGTGWEIKEYPGFHLGPYIGTFQTGPLVFHVFEVLP